MTFAERLTELRRSKNWSQEYLGELLGVTRQTVSKWELGMTTPEMEKIAMLSDIFGISTDELIKGNQSVGSDNMRFEEKKEPSGVEKEQNNPYSNKFHFEYKSPRTWRGLPLVHINVGAGRYAAKGVLAVGNAAKGIVAVGLAAMGIISVGLASLGVLACGFASLGLLIASGGIAAAGFLAAGGIAAGFFAFGGLAAGWLAFGGAAVGCYTVGGLSSAVNIAFGGYAQGTVAIGDIVEGTVCIDTAIPTEEALSIIKSALPDIPEWIARFFADLAESLT